MNKYREEIDFNLVVFSSQNVGVYPDKCVSLQKRHGSKLFFPECLLLLSLCSLPL